MTTEKQSIGPLWSNWGWKTWNLFLEPDQVVASPYSTWEALLLALHMQIGVPADPGAAAREGGRDLRSHQRFFPVSELESIAVVVSHGHNRIVLAKLGGEKQVFNIYHRPSTEEWMVTLSTMYPSLYQEIGVPKTALGRVLKW